jgi:hypothetical protein
VLAHIKDIAGRRGVDVVLGGVAARRLDAMSGRGSDSLVTLVSIKGDVLLVRCPGDVFRLQEVYDSGDTSEGLECKVY